MQFRDRWVLTAPWTRWPAIQKGDALTDWTGRPTGTVHDVEGQYVIIKRQPGGVLLRVRDTDIIHAFTTAGPNSEPDPEEVITRAQHFVTILRAERAVRWRRPVDLGPQEVGLLIEAVHAALVLIPPPKT